MQKKINKRRQSNNHARAKRRIKVFKLKMLSRRVMDMRDNKIIKSHKTRVLPLLEKQKIMRLMYRRLL